MQYLSDTFGICQSMHSILIEQILVEQNIRFKKHLDMHAMLHKELFAERFTFPSQKYILLNFL